MKLVVLGLSLSSSWGNGHATTYRSLLKAFAARGHAITFLERDVPWYAGTARDLEDPAFCRLLFYKETAELEVHAALVREADAVIVGSYVPDGVAVGAWVQATAGGITAFYDIDTPVTLAALDAGTCTYLSAALIPGYDRYLSFTGGLTLDRLRRHFGSPGPSALYCCVDPELYRPMQAATRWDLSYLGTYSPDRQPTLERLLLDPARRAPHLRFAVAGPQYPAEIEWPANVERLQHVGPHDHREFYGVSRFTLNVTRVDMVRAGFSPSVRLFEAAACGTPVVSDVWPGIESVFPPGTILLAQNGADVLTTLTTLSEGERRTIGTAARDTVLVAHSAAHRAGELEAALLSSRHESTAPRTSRVSLR